MVPWFSRSKGPGGDEAAQRALDRHGQGRAQMVRSQLAGRDVRDPRVLAAMARVPRERFVPPDLRDEAYEDSALGIGQGQTISQPYMVAIMSQHLGLVGGERVLEIGTGSGYQTAILAELVRGSADSGRVFTIERIESLLASARRLLGELGYDRVAYRLGDGSAGWPEEAPFDAILMTAYAQSVPPALVEQLNSGGRFVGPIGAGSVQTLVKWTRTATGEILKSNLLQCRFVPLIGPND